ncbi:hypothetical protein Tsubulata_047915 [Turnera subulata]|uniref:Uncharacterized protein n=1 Tax=Turnera subulata TaxID=218843 RepID=A0A9Q0JHP2_9ROSI|nr:hypothetical protein Tsubulata_047915 [Turnera subulata]
MSFSIVSGNGGGNGAKLLCTKPTTTHHLPLRPQLLSPLPSSSSSSSSPRWRSLQIVSAAKKLTSRFDSKNRRNSTTTKEQDEDREWKGDIDGGGASFESVGDIGGKVSSGEMPDWAQNLPGLEPDFWEGEQWDGLGFFVEYMWAFGIVFALIACGIAAFSYNEGATDFKETPAYKEAIQSQEQLLEQPGGSNADVFDSNPTEVAPSLD